MSWFLEKEILRRLECIESQLATLIAQGKREMAAIDELNKALTDIMTAVGDAITELQALAAALKAAPGDATAVAAAAAQVETLATNLEAAVTAAKTP